MHLTSEQTERVLKDLWCISTLTRNTPAGRVVDLLADWVTLTRNLNREETDADETA